MINSLIIIPTYNEAENVSLMIERIFSLYSQFHILIVDDSSPDGTSQIVQDLKNTKYNTNLFLKQRNKKEGLGAAYISGFNWGLEKNYKYFFQMDCDFSHDPNDIIKRLGNHD